MLVIASKFGYLCNRIVTFANAMAFAIEHNITVLNPAFDEYCRYFTGTEQDVVARYPPQKRKIYGRDKVRYLLYRLCCFPYKIHGNSRSSILKIGPVMSIDIGWSQRFLFDHADFAAQVRSIRNTPFVLLSGYYFLDMMDLTKHADTVREYFTPVSPYRENIRAILERERKEGDLLIGVHIRQNDYKDFCGGVYYFSSPEYQQVMQAIERLFPGRVLRFLICSDTQQDPGDFNAVSFGLGSGQLIEDIYSLAGCDYIVGPPSTFSGWASFYGNVPRLIMNNKERAMKGLPDDPLHIDAFKVSFKIHDN